MFSLEWFIRRKTKSSSLTVFKHGIIVENESLALFYSRIFLHGIRYPILYNSDRVSKSIIITASPARNRLATAHSIVDRFFLYALVNSSELS